MRPRRDARSAKRRDLPGMGDPGVPDDSRALADKRVAQASSIRSRRRLSALAEMTHLIRLGRGGEGTRLIRHGAVDERALPTSARIA
jgi:hypothetical protein